MRRNGWYVYAELANNKPNDIREVRGRKRGRESVEDESGGASAPRSLSVSLQYWPSL